MFWNKLWFYAKPRVKLLLRLLASLASAIVMTSSFLVLIGIGERDKQDVKQNVEKDDEQDVEEDDEQNDKRESFDS